MDSQDNGQHPTGPRPRTAIDYQFLLETLAVRRESDDPAAHYRDNSGVGAIIAIDGRELARAANVLPPRLKTYFQCNSIEVSDEQRYFVVEHAERAAINVALSSGASVKGATMYCSRFPCSDCARAISWSGIGRLVVPNGFSGESKWIESQRMALWILRKSGIRVRYIPL